MDVLHTVDLGLVPFRTALALQDRLRAARERDEIPDTLLLAQHELLLARGRGTTPAHLPMGVDWYLGQGLAIVDVDRAGGLVPHGPGQLVGYAITRTTDVRTFGCRTEDALAEAVGRFGVRAAGGGGGEPPRPGVWVGERRLATVGLRISRGVTTHGFAVNVANDLQPFAYVVAAGDAEVETTSMARELRDVSPVAPDPAAVASAVSETFAAAHDRVATPTAHPV